MNFREKAVKFGFVLALNKMGSILVTHGKPYKIVEYGDDCIAIVNDSGELHRIDDRYIGPNNRYIFITEKKYNELKNNVDE